jgi:hypothetical protein
MSEATVKRAIANIYHMSDTDVFPRPFENIILNDKSSEVVAEVARIVGDLKAGLGEQGSFHHEMLAPAGPLGFRRIASLDPLWNTVLLSLVLEMAPKIEAARPPLTDKSVFSYRFDGDPTAHKLFSEEGGWRAFLGRARELSEAHAYCVSTDISDFYSRLNHHRLENALKQCAPGESAPWAIMEILKNYSDTKSYGLPVGGNAARILAEACLIQIDHLLTLKGITYCRFVDDLIFFCETLDEAYALLAQVSELLSDNQGLLLQRSKTRILTAAELQSSIKISLDEDLEGASTELGQHRKRLSSLQLRYDPYSATSYDDYEALKKEINDIDLFMLLEYELSKSAIHIHSARRIVSAMRFSDDRITVQTAQTLIGELNRLYPIGYLVLDVVRSLLMELPAERRDEVKDALLAAYNAGSYAFSLDYHLLYFVRALAWCPGIDTLIALEQIYARSRSPLVRREVILAMHRLGVWSWLSNLKTQFPTLSDPERRAFIVASFGLSDEGSHWRQYIKGKLSAFEAIIVQWSSDPANRGRV